MKKRILIAIVMAAGFTVSAAAADNGEALFKSQGCTSCHRPQSTSKVNPSLAEIAQMYQGKEDRLVQYLNGEAEAIVKPDKAEMMKRHIEKTKQLSDADRKSIADFMMTYAK
ncbi:MAG: c-type cytochrome [Desulfobacterales bacterium]